MHFTVEEIKTSKKILLISKKNSVFRKKIQDALKEYDYKVVHEKILPSSLDEFAYLMIIDDLPTIRSILSNRIIKTDTLIVTVRKKSDSTKFSKLGLQYKLRHIKIANIANSDLSNSENIKKILWFMFSTQSHNYLDLEKNYFIEKNQSVQGTDHYYGVDYVINLINTYKKNIVLTSSAIIFVATIFFIIPMMVSQLFLYQAAISLKNDHFKNNAATYLHYGQPFLNGAQKTYKFSRPILSFFFLALFTDDLINATENGYSFVKVVVDSQENSKNIIDLILNKNKNEEEKKMLRFRISLLQDQVNELSEKATLLSEKTNYNFSSLPLIRLKLKEAVKILDQANRLLGHADAAIGGPEEKKYLLLFYNNMEIRPGGGFIGSFGIATFKDYTLQDLYVEDVYTADGQLKAHVEPPKALRDYLNQPHWFLRDSSFSPDFQINFEEAQFFLEKELGVTGLNGAVGMTTTAVSYLLNGFGEIYLPDYNEKITADNFYIKAQTYSEQNFFPGSTQKRNFLGNLVRTLLLSTGNLSYKKLVFSLKQALEEKQIAIFIKDKKIQKDIDGLGYGGKLIVPTCATKLDNCINDVFFPVDANLGVNKANFFISRQINLNLAFKRDGSIENVLSIQFKNNSDSEVFPGGDYKNYFQVYLPKEILIQDYYLNGKKIIDYTQEETNDFKIIGYFFIVPPNSKSEIKIYYKQQKKISQKNSVYQLVVQKQIGALNNDLTFQVSLPDNISVVDKNFTALAKGNNLIYNTSLSTDRIFFIELLKK